METDKQVANRRRSISKLSIVEALSIATILIGALQSAWYAVGIPEPEMAFPTAIALFSIGVAVFLLSSLVERRNIGGGTPK